MPETRAEKAQRLVDEGQVHILFDSAAYTQASTPGKHGLHTTVVYSNGKFWCTCDWGLYHAHTDDLCAHALAVRIAVERMNP